MKVEIMGYFTCSRDLLDQIKSDLHMWSECILGDESMGITYCLGELGLTIDDETVALSGEITPKGVNLLLILKGRFDLHEWGENEGGSLNVYVSRNDSDVDHLFEFETWKYQFDQFDKFDQFDIIRKYYEHFEKISDTKLGTLY